jgi:hypothetical protein
MVISISIIGIGNYEIKAKKAFESDIDLFGGSPLHNAAFP